MKITIDLDKLEALTASADKIFLEPDGEGVLLKLLEVEQQVADAIAGAKKKLEETALKLNPDFSSIQADKIKVYYRKYGSSYYVDESNLAGIPTNLYKTEVEVLTENIPSNQIKELLKQIGARVKEVVAPDGQQKTLIKRVINGKEIKGYLKEHKGLPVGIVAPDRKKQLTFALKKNVEAEDEAE